MLTIHIVNGHGQNWITSQLELTELFRTLRVIGEVPFIEPSPGTLLNLTHVERIHDDAAEVELVDRGIPAAEAPSGFGIDPCPHNYMRSTCSICTPAFTGVPQYRGKS